MVVDAQRYAADADAADRARTVLEEAGSGAPLGAAIVVADGEAGQEPVEEVRNGAPGAGIVADRGARYEACRGLPSALPWLRQHGRADHVARGQASEDLVEEFRREVAQQVDRTLHWRQRRRRRLRFARRKHGLVGG